MNRSTEILTISASTSSMQETEKYNPKKKPPQQILVAWNEQKTYTFFGLLICLIVWACVFFPLME